MPVRQWGTPMSVRQWGTFLVYPDEDCQLTPVRKSKELS